MEIKLTESEIRTLKFYLEKALIDAKGLQAVGMEIHIIMTYLKTKKNVMKKKRDL